MVWEAKSVPIYPRNEDGLPQRTYRLVVTRNVLAPDEVKYLVSNAPLNTPLSTLLLVAFSRWRVERCFEDEKGELGLDHYEGRKYRGLKRHMILTAVSHLFLAKVHLDLRGKKPELTVCQVRTAMSSLLRSLWLSGRCGTRLLEQTAKELRYAQARRTQARKSHTKATRRKLHAAGVRLTTLIRCRWAIDRAL